ncbi:hypothetical protein LZT26_21735, partial [Aeromonas hydrophila]|nr:hypothetical protein [Aeromonas hydrophila]
MHRDPDTTRELFHLDGDPTRSTTGLNASLPEQAGTDFKLALNGQPLPQHHALPLTQATRYFLSYLAPAA